MSLFARPFQIKIEIGRAEHQTTDGGLMFLKITRIYGVAVGVTVGPDDVVEVGVNVTVAVEGLITST